MKFKTLNEWLDWQESLHSSEIDLGLSRVSQVLECLLPELFELVPGSGKSQQKLPFTLITVGGTNGKGSTIALLESILLASGYQVGCYTSPHFLRYNERIRINGDNSDDTGICEAFEAIDKARGEISLTYFEFSTLAAIYLFVQQKCQVVILEVGLGGRLDAVNILDADCSLVTTVDLDHQDWLGDDIESIAYEKAGIYRGVRPAIYGDYQVPESLRKHALEISAELSILGSEYDFSLSDEHWLWKGPDNHYNNLPKPGLVGNLQLKNAANALMVLDCLKNQLSDVNLESITIGLQNSQLTGRYQKIADNPELLVDVAHNPQAAKKLVEYLADNPCVGKTHAIFAILADKDISGVVEPLTKQIQSWHLFELNMPRSLSAEKTANIVATFSDRSQVACYNDFSLAYQSIVENMSSLQQQQDRIIVFGSFFTVACALRHFSR